jgi:hypothetical protein
LSEDVAGPADLLGGSSLVDLIADKPRRLEARSAHEPPGSPRS